MGGAESSDHHVTLMLPEVCSLLGQDSAAAARAMRQVLVDHAGEQGVRKRGGGWTRVTLDESPGIPPPPDCEILDLHPSLERLAESNPRMARVVEVRALAGMEMKQDTEVLGTSKRKVEGDWSFARTWLGREPGWNGS